jgi:TolA-binding protein
MNRIEQRILSYPHLSRDEQRDVEAYVEENPEWASLLREVQMLESLASSVDPPEASSSTGASRAVSPDVLATYVVARHFARPDSSSRITTAFRDIEDRLAEDDELRQRAEEMQRRIEEVEETVDPLRHFAHVTGRDPGSMSDAADALPSAGDRQPASTEQRDAPGRDDRSRQRDAEREPDRGPKHDMAPISRPARWAMAAVALCVAVYGLLYAASWSTQSPVDRLAAMDVSTDVIEGYQTRVRSPMPQASADTTPDDLYLRALPLLRDARTSTLGLFPHFDLRKLSEAESLLQRVVDRTEPGSFLQLEAYFYLGKINLAQGEVETARTQFKKVVRREGRRAESAYQILKELEEVRPVGGGTASASLL